MSDFDFSSDLKDSGLQRRPDLPGAAVWLKHFLWFIATFVTTTLTGIYSLFYLENLLPPVADPQTLTEAFFLIVSIPWLYLSALHELAARIFADPSILTNGLKYSVSLLFILVCHEFGHYIACRIYRVDATLPYFIPSPPLIAVGTFGAFIRILTPLPSRRATFDIGVAGPIAGFIALIPVAIVGIYLAQPVPPGTPAQYTFTDPLLMRLIAWTMNVDLANSYTNPFYTTAWIGLLVTSLNLIPAGQLDGGHAVYAVFGGRVHAIVARVAFVTMAVLAVCGFIFYNSPSGILFAVILLIMLRIGHPEPYDDTPLDGKRRMIAALTLLIFILSFAPFPIQINLF